MAGRRNDAASRERVVASTKLKPEVRNLIQRLAERDSRNFSQQVEFMITDWLRQRGHLKSDPLIGGDS